MLPKRCVSVDIFVWIFATLAGALLLVFFLLWSGRHATTSTTVEDIELLRSFEQELFALGTGDELSKTLTFPRALDVRVTCDTFFTSQAQEKTSLFLFSPSTLTGKHSAHVFPKFFGYNTILVSPKNFVKVRC